MVRVVSRVVELCSFSVSRSTVYYVISEVEILADMLSCGCLSHVLCMGFLCGYRPTRDTAWFD